MGKNNEKKDPRKSGYGARRNSRTVKDSQRKDDGRPKTPVENNGTVYRDGSHCGNDPSWYRAYPQMTADAASLAFSNRLGEVFTEYPTAVEGDVNPLPSIPGIATFLYRVTPGVSIDGSSPINVAAKSLYSFVRHANSGSKNYDSSDLMMYVLQADSCYMFWSYMVRLYGALNTFSYSNAYLAKGVVEALGGNYDDLHTRIADFRAYINQFAYKMGSLCVPNTFSAVKRHIWMAGNVWKDSPGRKAQFYAYVPEHFTYYDEVYTQEASALRAVWPYPTGDGSDGLATLDSIIACGNKMVDSIITSESLMTMSGDIQKAFGDANLMKLETITADFKLDIQYSSEVLSQFRNLSIHAMGTTQDTLITATNADNLIQYDPVTLESQPANYLILNMEQDFPTPDDVMVATRCMCISDGDVITSCGSEVVTTMILYWYTGDGYDSIGFNSHFIKCSAEEYAGVLFELTALANFDWHPTMYLVHSNDNSFIGFFGDMDNYTIVKDYELRKMHTSALLAEYANPNMGTFLV